MAAEAALDAVTEVTPVSLAAVIITAVGFTPTLRIIAPLTQQQQPPPTANHMNLLTSTGIQTTQVKSKTFFD